jgi:4,5:9,10-diseco-3-hydroxy-5,9,17-trioxoandrosta-1(10),2-diene-4-oate hydrolase
MTQISLLQDKYIKVGSINTRYWDAGNHQGNSLILLHGGGSVLEVWAYNIPVLAQHHRVYAFDMVGTGLSDKPIVAYSLDYQVQFLKDFLQALNIPRATLIGNSMGGSVALKLALDSPERVEKIVLVSSLGLGREITLYHRFLSTFPVFVRMARPSRKGAQLLYRNIVYDSKTIPKELIEMCYQRFNIPSRKQALISLLRTNINFWGVRPELFDPIVTKLGGIQVPTLIIWGKKDPVLPVAHAYIAAKKIPNSHLHIFDKCGHWPQFEHPQKFNQLVLEFLQ